MRAAALESKTTQSEDQTETQSTVFLLKGGMENNAKRRPNGNSIGGLLFKGGMWHAETAKAQNDSPEQPLKSTRSIEFPFGQRCALPSFQARLHAPPIMFPDYSSQGWIPI